LNYTRLDPLSDTDHSTHDSCATWTEYEPPRAHLL